MLKKRLIKVLLIFILILLVIITSAIVVYKTKGKELIRKGIVTGAQKTLQVPVRLDEVDLVLSEGKATLTNLEIDNPEKYQDKAPTFLKMGQAYIDLDVRSLFTDTVKITTFKIDNIFIAIEQKGNTSNLEEILDNLPKSDAPDAEPESDVKDQGKDLLIDVLEINNIQVQAELLPIPGRADIVKFKLDPIRLENVGKDYRVSSAKLTAMIMQALSSGIIEKGSELLPIDMVGSLAESLGQQGLKVLEAGEKVGEGLIKGAAGGIEKGAEGAIKGIGGLFTQEKEEEEEE
jgi:hypothetical protein